MKKIIITGISGYIGSCLQLYLQKKFLISGIDKKSNKYCLINQCDLLKINSLNKILKKEKPDLIVHLAAQSLVDETINKNKYFLNNVVATKNLVHAMKKNNLKNIVFSSTAAVYKFNNKTLNEKSEIRPKSTYAKTKYECEKIIKKSRLNSIILRFFNVCSSLNINKRIIGEFHNPETHLIPTVVSKNLLKKKIYIYGNNYKTKDGTCIRDYVHIKDICSAIEKSIKFLLINNEQFEIINIGSSTTNTNLEILRKIEKMTKIKTISEIIKRRKGDVDLLTCSVKKAKSKLNWRPIFSNINNILNDEILWVKYLKKVNLKRKFKNYL
jgi:UDP-glucose 4-epimerase